jgi:hypothetical protein
MLKRYDCQNKEFPPGSFNCPSFPSIDNNTFTKKDPIKSFSPILATGAQAGKVE